MSDLPNEEIEGRLIAQREVLCTIIEALCEQGCGGTLLARLEDLLDVQNHQEDPGALPSKAFAVEGAKLDEIQHILERVSTAVRGRPEAAR